MRKIIIIIHIIYMRMKNFDFRKNFLMTLKHPSQQLPFFWWLFSIDTTSVYICMIVSSAHWALLSKAKHIFKIKKTEIGSRLGQLSIDFPASQALAMPVETVLQVAPTKVFEMKKKLKSPWFCWKKIKIFKKLPF